MQRILLLSFVLSALAFGFACSGEKPAGGGTPTEAYKQLYAAVKSKDVEAIKKTLSKNSIEFGAMAAQRQNSPVEKVYENGFTATTFSETLPSIRDERIKDDMAALEVWNSRESKWEDLPFVNEDGGWKLAIGEMFAGTYKSPGRGRDFLEKEAANAVSNTPSPSSNTNVNGVPSRTGDKNAK